MTLTCIVCPLGCQIEVTFRDSTKEIASIQGNTCKRGAQYAQAECTNPTRVLTTTVRCSNGSVLPVRTSTAIDKELLKKCMRTIQGVTADLPIRIGDVIIPNILETGADVIATANIPPVYHP